MNSGFGFVEREKILKSSKYGEVKWSFQMTGNDTEKKIVSDPVVPLKKIWFFFATVTLKTLKYLHQKQTKKEVSTQ